MTTSDDDDPGVQIGIILCLSEQRRFPYRSRQTMLYYTPDKIPLQGLDMPLHTALLSFLTLSLLAGLEIQEKPISMNKYEIELFTIFNDHRTSRTLIDGEIYRYLEGIKPISSLQSWSHLPTKGKAQPLVYSTHLSECARDLLSDGVQPQAGSIFKLPPKYINDRIESRGIPLIMFSAQSTDVFTAYISALVSPIGKRPRNGLPPSDIIIAEEALKDQWHEIGLAVSDKPGNLTAVVIIAPGLAKQYAGGCIYYDTNNNYNYDYNEGISSATIQYGSKTVTPNANGIWSIPIETEQSVNLIISTGELSISMEYKHSDGNQIFNWMVPRQADTKKVDALIAAVDAAQKSGATNEIRQSSIRLLLGTKTMTWDDKRRATINKLLSPINDEYDFMMEKLLKAINDDTGSVESAKYQKTWGKTMSPWFKEYDTLRSLREKITALSSMPVDKFQASSNTLIDQLKKGKAASLDLKFVALYDTWTKQVQELSASKKSASSQNTNKPKGR